MSTFRHTDLESLSEDLRMVWEAETETEKNEKLRELNLKISPEDLGKLYDAADRFMYNYDKAFIEEILGSE